MLDFGSKLAAMQTQRADSRPAPLNADVANLDVALPDARLALAAFAFDAFGAKIVWLEPHLISTINLER